MKTLKIDGVVQSCIKIELSTGPVQVYLPKTIPGATSLLSWIAGEKFLSGYTLERGEHNQEIFPITLGAALGPRAIVHGDQMKLLKIEFEDIE